MVQYQDKFFKPGEHFRDLQLLEEVARDSTMSQRKLSSCLGIALGVTNACLKKMIKKGHIKVKGINHKRIAYYLTPQGFNEKAKLTYNFLQHTIDYYKNLKENVISKLDLISKSGVKRLLFYGAGEVMEVAFICLNEKGIELVGIVDDSGDKQLKKIFGFNVQSPDAIKSFNPEAILVTSIRYKDIILNNLKKDKALEGVSFYSL